MHKMSTSMYEVFNWSHVNESRPKRLSLLKGASEINIDDPVPTHAHKSKSFHKGENFQAKEKKLNKNRKFGFIRYLFISFLVLFVLFCTKRKKTYLFSLFLHSIFFNFQMIFMNFCTATQKKIQNSIIVRS